MMALRLPRWCALLALFLGAGLACASEQDATMLEMRIKAAYLYRFASYVDWPETAFPQKDSALRIVIVGAEMLSSELAAAVKSESYNGRPISVQSYRQASDLAGAHIVFVSRNEAARLPALRQGNYLLVTESDGALRQGSVINFVLVGGQVRFEISLESAKQRNLRLSSRLLTVAHRVDTSARESILHALALAVRYGQRVQT